MIISEKGAVKALDEAYKKGYEIVPGEGGRIAIYTENWALETCTRHLPMKVSQKLVEHYREIPSEPAFVQGGKPNQCMMECEAKDRREEMMVYTRQETYMHRIPILFKEKWALFVTMEGKVFTFDQKYLDILDWNVGGCEMLVGQSDVGVFALGDERLTIAPGRFGTEDTRKLKKIAELYQEQKVQLEEVPEQLSLFEDMERED